MSIIVAIGGILLLIQGFMIMAKASTAMHEIAGVVCLAGGVTGIALSAVIWQLASIRRLLAEAAGRPMASTASSTASQQLPTEDSEATREVFRSRAR